MAQESSKSCFMYISVGQADLVKSLAQIELGETRRLTQIIQKLVDRRHRETILDRDGVQGAIVHAAPSRAIFLLNKEYWGGKRTVTGLDEVGLEHGGNLPFNLCFLVMGIAIGPDVYG